jgi:hypothetical protein
MTPSERLVWAAAFVEWTAREKYGGTFGFKRGAQALAGAKAAYNAVMCLRVMSGGPSPSNPTDQEAIHMLKEFADG